MKSEILSGTMKQQMLSSLLKEVLGFGTALKYSLGLLVLNYSRYYPFYDSFLNPSLASSEKMGNFCGHNPTLLSFVLEVLRILKNKKFRVSAQH